ncbi:MAG: PEP-utilizing enzyme, partial [Pseudomonadales bacterium]|nr:PEP-utilizing enzyme [Pseudomonadales bacterium]
VEANRLDEINHIFDVSMDDVDRAIVDSNFDLRAARSATTFQQQQRERVPSFPMFIDSRGRIPKITLANLPDDLDDDLVMGASVSPGVVTGRVKCLLNPFDKQIEPGDVLVAVTTDPGWTPLFINASAIVLEIGGELQHGALVAREYGKPCVSGIPQVLEQFEDGQLVEVDGDRGVVRILEQPAVSLA